MCFLDDFGASCEVKVILQHKLVREHLYNGNSIAPGLFLF